MLPALRVSGGCLGLSAAAGCRCARTRLSTAAAAQSTASPEAELRQRVLSSAVSLVPDHGWTRRCVEAGARALDLPESVADMAAPRGGGDLALHFVDACNEQLELALRAKAAGPAPPPAMSPDLVRFACRARLQLLRPLLPYWPAGLAALTASPGLATDGLARLRRLADDICHHAGDRSTDTGWYARRAAVAAIYCSAELFMLQDASDGLADTWAFLDRRVDGELAALMAAPAVARAACDVAVNIMGLSRR